MIDIVTFYNDILSKKRYYVPILFFAIVGYSFSIYNRTVGIDDFSRDINVGSGNRMLSGRWGMILWNKLVGITVALDPFIDRFLALVFLIIAAILFCYILYLIGGNKRIVSYTIAASTFITYPLINSIWEYTGADFMLTGNLCLVTLAAIVLMCINPFGKRVLYASVLLLLPVSSYESAIFYYTSLFCVIVFYEYYVGIDKISAEKVRYRQCHIYYVWYNQQEFMLYGSDKIKLQQYEQRIQRVGYSRFYISYPYRLIICVAPVFHVFTYGNDEYKACNRPYVLNSVYFYPSVYKHYDYKSQKQHERHVALSNKFYYYIHGLPPFRRIICSNKKRPQRKHLSLREHLLHLSYLKKSAVMLYCRIYSGVVRHFISIVHHIIVNSFR